jgi:mRNA-decapping enzyme 1B
VVVTKAGWSNRTNKGLTFAIGTTFVWSLYVFFLVFLSTIRWITSGGWTTENLVEDLFDDFVYEVQVPYILYRNATQEVNGIWFYNPRECEEVAKLFQRLFGTPLSFQSRILSTFSNKSQKTNLLPSRSEYQELEPMAGMLEGPLEPSIGTLSSVTEGTNEPLERFFNVCSLIFA